LLSFSRDVSGHPDTNFIINGGLNICHWDMAAGSFFPMMVIAVPVPVAV